MPATTTFAAGSIKAFGGNGRGAAAAPAAPRGCQIYSSPGGYTFIVPAGVTSISVVAIGAGGSGGYIASGTNYDTGGVGAALGYKNNIAVTPGQTMSLTVGTPGCKNTSAYGAIGYGSCFYFATVRGCSDGAGGTHIGDGGGRGGYGGTNGRPNGGAGGGGGAGGYCGTGGQGGGVAYGTTCGGYYAGSAGTGTYPGGTGGFGSNYSGGPGGGNSLYGHGGACANYGYGGGASSHGTGAGAAGNGGPGAIRIMWGPGRSFPLNAGP